MIVAVLQARMSSTRLPGKVLKPIIGVPMIERQVERLRFSQKIDRLVIATSLEPSDDVLENHCHHMKVDCFRGDLDDVLSRYFHASVEFNASHVVRLTADCPLTDAGVIDRVITEHIEHDNDFTSNTKPSTFPDGLDVEVMKQSVLEKAHKLATSAFDKEHVTPYISSHPEMFKIGCVKNTEDLSYHRWTVDNPEDFQLVNFVYQNLYVKNPNFTSNDIYQLLANNPKIYQLNRHFK